MNIVEKYGGTSVGTIEQIQAIALHAKHMKEQGHNLVIVASAMGKTTNKLIELAIQTNENWILYYLRVSNKQLHFLRLR